MMKIFTFVIPVVLAGAVGCATDPGPGGDGSGDGSGSGSGSNNNNPVCGDNVCAASETNASCATDCPVTTTCGDGTCSGGESAANCSQDCGPTCGDNICNGSETTASCASDCPQTACTTAPDNCTGDTVCIAGSCSAAYGRVYKLHIVDGVMPEKDANMAAWDSFGGLPDPYVNLFLNGTHMMSTTYKSDTLTPNWSENTTITVAAGAKIQLDAKDDDIDVVDGQMFSCFNVALTADVLRKHGGAHTNTCIGSAAGTSLRFYFVPQ